MILCAGQVEQNLSFYNDGSIILYPPKKISKSYYRCDKKFHIDTIIEMYDDANTTKYGIILLSGKEYRLYLVELFGAQHKEIKLLACDTESLQKKQRKGGQSAPRFERIRQEKYLHYTKKLAEIIVQTYMRNNHTKYIVDHFIVGGCGDVKRNVMETDLFVQHISSRVVQTMTTGEINDGTIYDVCEMCNSSIFRDIKDNKFDEIIGEIDELIQNNPDKLAFGQEINAHIDENNLEKLIISDQISNDDIEILKNRVSKNCSIMRIGHEWISKYGQMVGIKFY